MSALIRDAEKLERDAAVLEQSAFTAEGDCRQGLAEMAARLRRAAALIRAGKIAGVPAR